MFRILYTELIVLKKTLYWKRLNNIINVTDITLLDKYSVFIFS